MKDGERALLALAAVGGYLYWATTSTAGNTPLSRVRRQGPYRDMEQSSSRLVVGPFPNGSKVLDMTEMGANPKPKKRGIHNEFKPVASSVPRERPLTLVPNRNEMFGQLSDADKKLLMEGGGGMNDKQRVQLMEKYNWYLEGMHPDSTTFGADGKKQ